MTEESRSTGIAQLVPPSAQQLERLMIERGRGRFQGSTVSGLRRVFGGNARSAWSFELTGTAEPLRAIVLVQKPAGQIDTDLAHEFDILTMLENTSVPSPRPIALDAAGEFLGAPTIVLEMLPGVGSAGGFLGMPDAAVGRELLTEVARHAAALHAVPVDVADSQEARHTVVRAQLDHWEYAFVDARRAMPALSSIFGWLGEYLPVPDQVGIVHGDLRAGNFLYVDNTVTALLDWEMAHVGDPVEDLAWMYGRLWSPKRFLSPEDFLACYAQAAERHVPADVFRYYQIFCEAKFATISLKASALFADGVTTNIRLADRAAEAVLSVRRCLELIDEDGRP